MKYKYYKLSHVDSFYTERNGVFFHWGDSVWRTPTVVKCVADLTSYREMTLFELKWLDISLFE